MTVPVPALGATITDTSGNTGISKFDPNTGKPQTPADTSGALEAPSYAGQQGTWVGSHFIKFNARRQ